MARVIRSLHNAEDGIALNDANIQMEMKRVVARQFDWQRGFLNMPQFYRSTFIYGQGPSADFFEKSCGLSISDFSLIGVGLYGFLMSNPFMSKNMQWTELEITPEKWKKALALLCVPAVEFRQLAVTLRRGPGHSAYKQSLLRKHPCMNFDDRIRPPLPQLILERITSGLFYDVVGGSGPVREDYGRRFETYCLEYINAMIPDLEPRIEWRYKLAKQNYDTPDIICLSDDCVELAIECKATKMSFAAKFSEDPLAERGYDDIVKAVFQLWRFFSHSRRGVTGSKVCGNTVGLVLTLESWLVMAGPLYANIIERAEAMAAAKDPEILEQDRLPVAFVSIQDFETTLKCATRTSLLAALHEISTPEAYGWMLDSIHEKHCDPTVEEKRYPFADRFAEVVPWWQLIEDKEKLS